MQRGLSVEDLLAIRERQINSMSKRMSHIVTTCEEVKKMSVPYATLRLAERGTNGWHGQSYAEKARSKRRSAQEQEE
jgi:hypothetical protein